MTASAAELGRTTSVTLTSLAGPCLLLAGLLIVISQFAVWPLRGGEIITTLTSPIYLPAMTGYLIECGC